jgi:hypothetical protein
MAPPIWGLGDGSCPVHQRSRPLRRAPSRRLPASGNVSERAHLSNRAHTRPGGFEFADVSGSCGRLLRAISSSRNRLRVPRERDGGGDCTGMHLAIVGQLARVASSRQER